MTIYSIQIVMPHSGNLSRSSATRLLKREVENQHGKGCNVKEICSIYNALHIEDINCKYKTSLY